MYAWSVSRALKICFLFFCPVSSLFFGEQFCQASYYAKAECSGFLTELWKKGRERKGKQKERRKGQLFATDLLNILEGIPCSDFWTADF
jgi:hypothetical protein